MLVWSSELWNSGRKRSYEVLDGASVTDVAMRYGVARQMLHEWLHKYANEGIGALVDKSSKPQNCPHQMAPEVEARILEMRRKHPVSVQVIPQPDATAFK